MQALQTRERELTELAATAQLAALRAQINPHFLFNSLNSIAQLIHADPDKAEACVERLAEIFRYILRRAEQEFVPLAEELQMARAPTSTSSARASASACASRPASTRAACSQLIPNLILQPLVENAVKHGLSRKLGPRHGPHRRRDGRRRCSRSRSATTGSAWPSAALGEVYERGVGLRNLRDRLERLYGPAHLPEITSAPGAARASGCACRSGAARGRRVTQWPRSARSSSTTRSWRAIGWSASSRGSTASR